MHCNFPPKPYLPPPQPSFNRIYLEKPFFKLNSLNINSCLLNNREQTKNNTKKRYYYVLAFVRNNTGHIEIFNGFNLLKSLHPNPQSNETPTSSESETTRSWTDISFYITKDLTQPFKYFYTKKDNGSIHVDVDKETFISANDPEFKPINKQDYFHSYLRTVALLFSEGKIFPKDDTEGLSWHKRAAKEGNFISSRQAAIMYELGIGTRINPKKAFKYCEKAYKLQKNSPEAKKHLLDYCKNGFGIEFDSKKCRRYITKLEYRGNN